MSDQVKPHHIALLHSLSKFVSAIVILVGCLVLLGWLRMKGRQADLYETEFGVLLLVMASIAGLTAMIAWTTRALDRTDTARKLVEEQFRLIVSHVSDAIVYLDLAGIVRWANHQAVVISGRPMEKMVGQSFMTILAPESAARAEARLAAIRRRESVPPLVEFEVLRLDGSSVWVEANFTSVLEDGKVVGRMLVARDITERKRLEEQFRQAQRMEAVGRLAGGIAHDFNNLLTVITGYSQMCLNQLGPDDPLRHQVEEIKKAGERAEALTNQLLAFSRKQVLQLRVLDLNAVVANMDRMLQQVIGENIELHTVLRSELERVKADPGYIEQIIMNLVLNARDAMPDGGMLTIETANVELDAAYAQTHMAVTPGRYVMLAVSDTGCGMDEETQRHVFEPFFTTKEKGKGTGIGLSTVYEIVKQSAGYIWVYSEPRRGTTFKFYLPSVEEPAETVEPHMPGAQSPRGSETVLLVEDEESVRTLARAVLEANGYQVLEARNGTEAFSLSGQHTGPIHLMATDVVMPGMSGRELAECLQSARPTLKILYVSGYPDDTIVRHGILDSNVAFLQKPFTPDALARKVRETLEAHKNRG
ncbi:MAG: PAS domain S-box protein [Nitrospirae bacterium]|nr:PAS domain S-box protein [Nitrospirota bacterium]